MGHGCHDCGCPNGCECPEVVAQREQWQKEREAKEREREKGTLREQIKLLHKARFSPEFHEHRKGMIPAMVKDLAEKIFEDLRFEDSMPDDGRDEYWMVPDSVEVRAVKKAWELMNSIGLRECAPAVE
jgi:hypothetical protein